MVDGNISRLSSLTQARMYGGDGPRGNKGTLSYWQDQVNLTSHGNASSWGIGEDDPSPQRVLDRLVARGKSNKTSLVEGSYMIGDRVSLPPRTPAWYRIDSSYLELVL